MGDGGAGGGGGIPLGLRYKDSQLLERHHLQLPTPSINMSTLSSRSFRLKKKDAESPPGSPDTSRKRTNTLSRLFKRRSSSFSSHNSDNTSDSLRFSNIRKSESLQSVGSRRNSRKTSPTKEKSENSDSLTNQTNENGHRAMFNGDKLDLSKMPKLPTVKSIKPAKTKLHELDAVRRKLMGGEHSGHHLPHILHKGSKDTDSNHTERSLGTPDEDDDIDTDSDEFKQPLVITMDNSNTVNKATDTKRRFQRSKHSRPVSSTPNPTDEEDAADDSISPNKTQEHSGLLSTLMNTFNLKSYTDLPSLMKTTEEENEPISEGSESNILHSVSPSANGKDSKPDMLDSVNFVPLKKSLVTTLGQGSLTLDAFPRNQTQLPNQDQENILIDKNTSNQNISTLSTSSPNINVTQSSINNTENAKMRRSISVLSRKTSKTAYSSTLSDDEDNSNLPTSPLSHSLSFKKKLKLPLSSKRQSSESASQMLSMTPDEVFDANLPSNKRRDALFERLDVKPPGDKRQENFHSLFNTLPADELLIEDFTCAYRKDILIHGKFYLTNHYICFHSKIIGLVTHLAIPLNSILKMQKKKTLGIPNAIEFSNLHQKYNFASFISRDQVYDLIHKVWRLNTLNSESFEAELDEDELESLDTISVESTNDDEDEEESDPTSKKVDYTLNKVSTDNTSDTSISDQENMVKDETNDDDDSSNKKNDAQLFNGIKMEGPKTHAETSTGYTMESGETKITEEIIKAPMGVVYSLMFGDDVSFMKNLLKVQKNFDIGEIPAFSNDKRVYRYVKPVNGGPVGPKQTKCIVEETIEKKDFDKYCLIVQSTESPDVPSGNSFKVRTKVFLNWAANNSTRLYIVTTVVWTGKSWIKMAIEKGAISGQKEALGILVSELRKKIVAGGNSGDSKGKKKNKKSKGRSQEDVAEEATEVEEVVAPPQPKSYMDIFMEQLDLKLILISLLFVIIISDKFKGIGHTHHREVYSNERMLMSESSLWEWIEQRERMSVKTGDSEHDLKKANIPLKEKAIKKMTQRDMKDAIELMEQHIDALKERTDKYDKLL